MPVPPGMLQSHLFVNGGGAVNQRICRVQLCYEKHENRPLPEEISRAPLPLLMRRHAGNTLQQDKLADWQQTNPQHEIVLEPMKDSSPPAIAEWNRQVDASAVVGMYWSIDLPRPDGSRQYERMYQLLVQPVKGSSNRTASGVPTPRKVRAWIATKAVFIGMLIQKQPPQARIPMSPNGISNYPTNLKQIGQNEAKLQRDAINELQGRSSGVITNRALHSLSQAHEEWPFGAVAELLDNAVDAEASSVRINLVKGSDPGDEPYLAFQDDGCGMDDETLRHMLREVGWTSKVSGRQSEAKGVIGKYGQGFKTGCFRMGANVVVITKKATPQLVTPFAAPVARALGISSSSSSAAAGDNGSDWNIGFLSLPGQDSNPSPFDGSPEWNQPATTHLLKYNSIAGFDQSKPDWKNSWKEILRRSPIRSLDDLQRHIKSFQEQPGTLILISRLRKYGNELELQVPLNEADIVLPHRKQYPLRLWFGDKMRMDYSVTAYAEVLYRKPRLHIYVQGERVQTRLAEATLRQVNEAGLYENSSKKYRLYLGYSDSAKNDDVRGVLLYHGNRLISSYQHHETLDFGYIGVLDTLNVRDVDVMNNKQRYVDSTKPYLELQAWIRVQCEQFTDHVQELRAKGQDIFKDIKDDWVECDQCRKWRKYPYTIRDQVRPKKSFKCTDVHWNPDYNHCDAPQEEWEPQEWKAIEGVPPEDQSAEQRRAQSKKLKKEKAKFQLRTVGQQEPRPWSHFSHQICEQNFVGEGSFARVYAAIDPITEKLVALKHFSISPGAADVAELRDKFLKEMDNQRLVTHSNVVSAVGWVDHETNLCLVMQYVNGDNLGKIIHGGPKHNPLQLSVDEKHAILVGTAEGLAAMHQEHIVHRDIKPQNVIVEGMRAPSRDNNDSGMMMTAAASSSSNSSAAFSHAVPNCPQGERSGASPLPVARVCDFGLAHRVKAQGATMTTRGSQYLVGTWAYAPPEKAKQQWGRDADLLFCLEEGEDGLDGSHLAPKKSSNEHKAGDVWSFGLVMLELLTGEKVKIRALREGRKVNVKCPLPFGHRPNDHESYFDVRMGDDAFLRLIAEGHLPYCDPTLPANRPYLGVLSACIAQEPSQRSSMVNIVKMLKQIKYGSLHPEWEFPSKALLYRVLSTPGQTRPNLSKGLLAKQQESKYSPQQHVSTAGLDSHYLSTTKSFNWALWYWCKLMIGGLTGSRYNNTDRLPGKESPYTIVIDLSRGDAARTMEIITHDMKAHSQANNYRMRFAHSADEVLIEKKLPRECIIKVYDFIRSAAGRGLLKFSQENCLIMKHNGPVTLISFSDWLKKVMEHSPFKARFGSSQFQDELRKDSEVPRADWDRPDEDIEDGKGTKAGLNTNRRRLSRTDNEEGPARKKSKTMHTGSRLSAPVAPSDTAVSESVNASSSRPPPASNRKVAGSARAAASTKMSDDHEYDSDSSTSSTSSNSDTSSSFSSSESDSNSDSDSDSNSDASASEWDEDDPIVGKGRVKESKQLQATWKQKPKRELTMFERVKKHFYHSEWKKGNHARIGVRSYTNPEFTLAARTKYDGMTEQQRKEYVAQDVIEKSK